MAADSNQNSNDKSKGVDPKNPRNVSGSVLVAMEKAKEDRKIKLWHNRLAFLKKGNALMQNKLFGDAAVMYEKYIKILEMVYETPTGELDPGMFKDTARTAELPVITSVYWDLLRIYDTSPSCSDRQKKVAVQLARFATMTPLYADIVKKAEIFLRQSRNPAAVKIFLEKANVKRPRCFIATAAFESPLKKEVQILRFYRDFYLLESTFGNAFVQFYYLISPSVAQFIENKPLFKAVIRVFLRGLIRCVSLFIRILNISKNNSLSN